MEPIRFGWLMCYMITWVVALIGAYALALSFNKAYESQAPEAFFVTAAVYGVALLTLRAILSSQRSRLHNAFDAWREKGVQLLDGTASYSADRGLSESDFNDSGLNTHFYNSYATSHFLAVGDIRSSGLSVKNVYTQSYLRTESYTDLQGQMQLRTVEEERTVVESIFDGLLLILPAELPHSAWVVLRHRDYGVPKGLSRLSVASPFLVKNYAVGASDKFAGHRTLTPSLMEAIGEYAQRFKYSPGYSYRAGMLYLTIPHYWLDFGQRPGKWMPVTTARLNNVLECCRNAIHFLKATAANLVPT